MPTLEEAKTQVLQIIDGARTSQNQIMAASRESVRRVLDSIDLDPEPTKTMHNILVAFNDQQPKTEYLEGLQLYCIRQNAWLAKMGIKVKRYTVEATAVKGNPGDYNFKTLVEELISKKAITLNGYNAYYLWMQSPGITISGTIGGDVWGQKGGRHGNREPGISAWDVDGTHCLATGRPLNTQRVLPLDWAMGAAAHEDGHKFLLPCADAPHGPECIMERWWPWPVQVYEREGWIWSDEGEKRRQPGDEVEYLLGSGFYVKV